MVNKVSAKSRMPRADVLRYSFEAAVLTCNGTVSRSATNARALLDAMITVRTTSWIADKVKALWAAAPDDLQADILRGLLERILPIARDKGMAYVMKMREVNL